jgi:uncharacterized protein YcaQ
MRISLATARRLALRCQGLGGSWDLPAGKEGAAWTVERLGYVQIDTIAVVQRAHHHTLWARCPGYEPSMLDELQAADRRVFEYWTHAASYLPMSEYRYCLPRMRWEREHGRAAQWLDANRQIADRVLDRIRTEGPLAGADFEDTRKKRGPWWDWKPAKQALEAFFSTGELMVTERRNFQRIYDLAERVLPRGIDLAEPSHDEDIRHNVRRMLTSMGLLSVDHLNWHLSRQREALEGRLHEMVDSGEAVKVTVRGLDGDGLFAHAPSLEAARKGRASRRVHLLSPFDNLTISRRWLAHLFGFEYKLECYTPAAKRRWGYFCLPLVWGDGFVGRIDAKADRKGRTLVLRRVWIEDRRAQTDAFLARLGEAVRRFAAFNECEGVKVEAVVPAALKAPLTGALEKVS